jgi:tetratricopeptide (TPR) repeat protein
MVPFDRVQAMFSAKAAVRAGDALFAGGNAAAAFRLYARAARTRLPEAEYRVGRCYLEGAGVPLCVAEAIIWLERAGHHQHLEAQALLALLSGAMADPNSQAASSPIGPIAERADSDAAKEGSMRFQDTPCRCGSGLRSCRCCDLSTTYTAPSEMRLQMGSLVARAERALTDGDAVAAATLCRNVLDVAPRTPGALWILAQICHREDQREAATALLQRLVAVDSNNVDATLEAGMLLFQAGNLAAAERHARNAVRLAPMNPRSHNLMGMVLTEAQHPHIGEFHYRRVLEITGGRDPILLANLAWNLKGQGRVAEARQLYVESADMAPDVFQTLFGWAQLEEADRNLHVARSKLDCAAAIRPNDPGLRAARARLLDRSGEHAAALAELESDAADRCADVAGHAAEPNVLLEKGRLLDQLGRYDEAFACFDEAKRLLRQTTGKSYLSQAVRDMADRLRSFFIGDRIRLMPTTQIREGVAQPIFILGFPRSGTTLAEQALASHPRISAADELPFVEELADAIPRWFGSPLAYPEALSELWMGDNRFGLDILRDIYLRKVELRGVIEPGSAWFTDKMPLNETHLGLISLVFPRSPLIHILRHPLDVILSAFSHNLTHGYFCATALETLAQHYVLVMGLVQHYRAELALRYLPVRYEDMVEDMNGSVQRMLDFVGESFDERCVRFQDNRRLAHTPSYAQVSEKIYRRSRFRYRNYLKHLEPAISIVQPIMASLGYSWD